MGPEGVSARRIIRDVWGAVYFGVGVGLAWGLAYIRQAVTRGRAASGAEPLSEPADTVILYTMDGIRMLELFEGPDPEQTDDTAGGPLMPYLMDEIVPRGGFLGDPARGSHFGLGNPVGLSMPGYQSIFSGRVTACFSNDCRPLQGDTLVHSVAEAFGAESVGFYSSYGKLCDTVCLPDGATRKCMYWKDNKDWRGKPAGTRDGMVFDAAIQRLRSDPPKFLYIGVEETDMVGHLGHYDTYMRLLAQYDQQLRDLLAEIAQLRETGHRVTLLIGTDHGRGSGKDWGEHRWDVAGTEVLWLAGFGHGIAAQGRLQGGARRSLLSIRATVQYLLGLDPGRQPVLLELFERGE